MEEKDVKRIINNEIRSHRHDGVLAQLVAFEDIEGMIKTVDNATDLANILAETPTEVCEQIFIDTTTAVKKLYIYDVPGTTWYYIILDLPAGLSGTKVYYVSDTSGGAVTRKLTFTDGILTAET